MATGERNLENSLSESLPANQSEAEPLACEEKVFVSGCENTTNTHSGESFSVKDKSEREGFIEIADKNESVCDSKSKSCDNGDKSNIECNESKEGDCCNPENVKSCAAKACGKSSAQTKTRIIDEVLNEEDEVEKECSEDEEEHYESAEEHLTPDEVEERIKEALDLKSLGNNHFKNQEYVEAKDFYSRAIKHCPKESSENKSVFYSNRAACSQKMEDYESAITDCTKALELAPKYTKARLRRAHCYEKVDKLEEALEDYKIVFESDRSCQTAREAIMRLPEEIKVKHEKLKEEMIGKLKDLGNMVLRPFGLSTDNFKLQQDPNSGGYSINFQKSDCGDAGSQHRDAFSKYAQEVSDSSYALKGKESFSPEVAQSIWATSGEKLSLPFKA